MHFLILSQQTQMQIATWNENYLFFGHTVV